ncbi:MAG: hypothetical protein DMG68_15100 [Acidobacteria bacterium]|nr:MAG: hypothetical protein DMG68_15100 [Acidobacteriota bacterium]
MCTFLHTENYRILLTSANRRQDETSKLLSRQWLGNSAASGYLVPFFGLASAPFLVTKEAADSLCFSSIALDFSLPVPARGTTPSIAFQ